MEPTKYFVSYAYDVEGKGQMFGNSVFDSEDKLDSYDKLIKVSDAIIAEYKKVFPNKNIKLIILFYREM